MTTARQRAVARWAQRAREATAQRDAAIRDARTEGSSLREIADAAGLSHTAIAKILTRTGERAPVSRVDGSLAPRRSHPYISLDAKR